MKAYIVWFNPEYEFAREAAENLSGTHFPEEAYQDINLALTVHFIAQGFLTCDGFLSSIVSSIEPMDAFIQRANNDEICISVCYGQVIAFVSMG